MSVLGMTLIKLRIGDLGFCGLECLEECLEIGVCGGKEEERGLVLGFEDVHLNLGNFFILIKN